MSDVFALVLADGCSPVSFRAMEGKIWRGVVEEPLRNTVPGLLKWMKSWTEMILGRRRRKTQGSSHIPKLKTRWAKSDIFEPGI